VAWPAATACRLAIAVAGAAAPVWAVADLAANPAAWALALLAVRAAAVASSLPMRIPRAKHSPSTADQCTCIVPAASGQRA
jgi:hypothetical protein